MRLMSTLNQVHTGTYFLFRINFNSIFPLCLGPPSDHFPLSFPTETAYIYLSHACVQFRNRTNF